MVSMRGSVPEFELPRGRSMADSVRFVSRFSEPAVLPKRLPNFDSGRERSRPGEFDGYHEEES